jgi:hypothetical protein
VGGGEVKRNAGMLCEIVGRTRKRRIVEKTAVITKSIACRLTTEVPCNIMNPFGGEKETWH